MTVRPKGRRARVAAVVGALATTGAVTLMAVVSGTAAAAPAVGQPGRCVDNVNVRAQPAATAAVVAVCERGQAVQVGESRDGYVHLLDLDGWSAQQYISVNGRMPASAGSSPATGAATGPGRDATGADPVSPTRGSGESGPTGRPDRSGQPDRPETSGQPDRSGRQGGPDRTAGTSGTGDATPTPTPTPTPGAANGTGDGTDPRTDPADPGAGDGKVTTYRRTGLAGFLGG